jgi:hypothetical protein
MAVLFLKQQPFYWERKPWQARDVVYEKNGKRFSFDATLAQDSEKFLLVKGGWKKDCCAVCSWEIFETDDSSHGIGYTNGLLWVCEECTSVLLLGISSLQRTPTLHTEEPALVASQLPAMSSPAIKITNIKSVT